MSDKITATSARIDITRYQQLKPSFAGSCNVIHKPQKVGKWREHEVFEADTAGAVVSAIEERLKAGQFRGALTVNVKYTEQFNWDTEQKQ